MSPLKRTKSTYIYLHESLNTYFLGKKISHKIHFYLHMHIHIHVNIEKKNCTSSHSTLNNDYPLGGQEIG